MDFGCSCNVITEQEFRRLGLRSNSRITETLQGFGGGLVRSLENVQFTLEIDEVRRDTDADWCPTIYQACLC